MAYTHTSHGPAKPRWKRAGLYTVLGVLCLAVVAGTVNAWQQRDRTTTPNPVTPNPVTRTYRIAGMAITVPGEWTRVNQATKPGMSILYLADPGHALGGMTFSVITASYVGAGTPTFRGLARMAIAEAEANPSFSNVHGRVVRLPAGDAFQVQSTVTKDGRTFTDIKYDFLRGNRIYVVTFMGLPDLMRSHATQITAAANSIELTG